jgi:hypothetical protein
LGHAVFRQAHLVNSMVELKGKLDDWNPCVFVFNILYIYIYLYKHIQYVCANHVNVIRANSKMDISWCIAR